MRLFLHLCLIAVAITGPSDPTKTLASEYKVNADVPGGVLNLRNGPGLDHPITVAIPAGSEGIELGACKSGDDGVSKMPWCRAAWKGNNGWVSSCCITQVSATGVDSNDGMRQYVDNQWRICQLYTNQQNCTKTEVQTDHAGYHTFFTVTYGPFRFLPLPGAVAFGYEGRVEGEQEAPKKGWVVGGKMYVRGVAGTSRLATQNIGGSVTFPPSDISRYESQDEPNGEGYTLEAFCNDKGPCVTSSGWPDRKVTAAYVIFCDPTVRDRV